MPKTVGVAVSNATFHFDKLYTYAVMPDQQDTVRLGSMVLVPFGRGSCARMGVVLACDAEPESAKLKFLFDVAPASACLTPELLRPAAWRSAWALGAACPPACRHFPCGGRAAFEAPGSRRPPPRWACTARRRG